MDKHSPEDGNTSSGSLLPGILWASLGKNHLSLINTFSIPESQSCLNNCWKWPRRKRTPSSFSYFYLSTYTFLLLAYPSKGLGEGTWWHKRRQSQLGDSLSRWFLQSRCFLLFNKEKGRENRSQESVNQNLLMAVCWNPAAGFAFVSSLMKVFQHHVRKKKKEEVS